MPISQSDFVISISPNPARAVLGMTGTITLAFSNTSLIEKGYNLTASLVLPDGVSFDSSPLTPSSVTNGPNGTIIVEWLSIKDLAPNESYSFPVTLLSDALFRQTGLPVPFDSPLTPFKFTAYVDTLPQGGPLPNVQITKNIDLSFIPLRYNLIKSAPGKMPKGAGLIPSPNPIWPYTYELQISNNVNIPSTVTLVDNLPNGIRYLGNLTITPSGYPVELANPQIIGPPTQDFVSLRWGFAAPLILPPYSSYTIRFDAAIWDNYTVSGVENSGARIPHGTAMINNAEMNGASGPVQVATTTLAMDLTIDKRRTTAAFTDTGQTISYLLEYKVNQYDSIDNVVITDTISDGQTYTVDSASLPPINPTPPKNPDGTTTLTWNLGILSTGTDATISFATTVDASYLDSRPVVAGDTLSNTAAINGLNTVYTQATPDSSSASSSIKLPTLTKQITGLFYADGSPKAIAIPAAPGDLIEILLAYDASTITAQQKNIEIDDFAPLNTGPFPQAGADYSYGGNLTSYSGPTTIYPNGVTWQLGSLGPTGRFVPGGSTWTVQFKIPVSTLPADFFVGSRNNYGKLSGENTEGIGYSDRYLVEISFGEANPVLKKTVTGPNVNGIQAGETYTYTITVSNPIAADQPTADAFEMLLTDVVPPNLTLTGSPVVSGIGSYDPPNFTLFPSFSWRIIKLPPQGSLTLTFSVIVAPTVISGQVLTNTAILPQPYSQAPPNNVFQYPGANLTSSATLKANGLTIVKTINPPFAKIGDIVTNIITVTVPKGTIATNIAMTDTFPIATQNYIGNATINLLAVTPNVVGGLVSFPGIPTVNAISAAVNIVYTFDTRVVNENPGSHVAPFKDNQLNSATVVWQILGVPSSPVITSANLEVRTPNLLATKEQRNVTAGGSFIQMPVNYNVGDIIEYRFTISNNGAAPAYNTQIVDTLNSFISFVTGSFIATAGTPTINLGPPQIVNWNIPFIDTNGAVTLTFRVNTLTGIGAGATISNLFTTTSYNTNDNSFGISYGPLNSNIVVLNAPNATLTKAALTDGKIGDQINYTITATLPFGTVMYNTTITDTLPNSLLPPRQKYVSPPPNATWTEDLNPPTIVAPNVVGQLVTLKSPQIPFLLDAALAQKVYRFTFPAQITNVPHGPTYTESQTDTAQIQWALNTSGLPLSQSITKTLSITATTPNILIEKFQKNGLNGTYTKNPLTILPGDTIYYKLLVTSNGASPAYNININDVLSTDLIYDNSTLGIISGPTAGTITPPADGPDGTLYWSIPQLNNGLTATVEFGVYAALPLPSSYTIKNKIVNAQYDSNHPDFIVYTASSNETVLNVKALEISKDTAPTVYQIGDVVTYNITINIPNNVSAYNLVVEDNLSPRHNYVSGSWLSSLPGTLTVITPNNIKYAFTANPIVGPLSINISFQSMIIDGLTTPPYTESQKNIASLHWDLTPLGPSAPTVSASKDITVLCPNITILKEQKKRGEPESSYTTGNLTGLAVGDFIDYRITLTNIGTGTAYDIVTSDILSPDLTYSNLIPPTPLGTITPPPPRSGGTISWVYDIPAGLAAGNSSILKFEVEVTGGSFESTTNSANSVYFSSTGPAKITLGPIKSNVVGFLQVPPSMKKSSVNISNPSLVPFVETTAFVMDIIEYTVEIVIPLGNIAYDVQLIDTLPVGQNYVGPATLDDMPIIPVYSIPTITFPKVPFIDATNATQMRKYKFHVQITAASTPYTIQTNTATLQWNKQPSSDPGVPIVATTNVYATEPALTLLKEQKLFDDPTFQITPIQINTDATIVYRFTITNNKPYTIYNIIASETLNNLYYFIRATTVKGVIIHDGSITGGILQWSISNLLAGETATAEIYVTVDSGGAVNGNIANIFSTIYTLDNSGGSPVWGPQYSNSVEGNFPSISFNKYASPENVAVGDLVTYYIDVIIPTGLTIYNLVITDTINSKQIYIGNAFIAGTPVFLTPSNNIVTFPPQRFTAYDNQARVVTYQFDARVLDGKNLPSLSPTVPPVPLPPPPIPAPYQESQTNNAGATWTNEIATITYGPINTSTNIIVSRPYIWVAKEQNNVTQGTGFVTTIIPLASGDIIEYRLTAHNFGSSTAFNVVITDVLDSNFTFTGIYTATAGTIGFDPLTKTLVWTVPEIAKNTAESLTFTVTIDVNLPLGSTEKNLGTFTNDSTNTFPIHYTGSSNTVEAAYPLASLVKTATTTNIFVGLTVKFTIVVTIPKKTTSYNLRLIDTLPPGFIYSGNPTLNSTPISGVIADNLIVAFPVIPFFGPFPTNQQLVYTFDATAVSVPIPPGQTTTTYTNNAAIIWQPTPDAPITGISYDLILTATNSTLLVVLKQRNVEQEITFTTLPLQGSPGDIIEYQIEITNPGPNNLYDIIALVDMQPVLSFISPINVPSGVLTHSGEPTNGIVNWSFPDLPVGSTIRAIYSTKIVDNATGTITEQTIVSFANSSGSPQRFGNIFSNEVKIYIPSAARGILFICNI